MYSINACSMNSKSFHMSSNPLLISIGIVLGGIVWAIAAILLLSTMH